MQLAKRELEKLSRDIRLAQQHGVMETNPKIVPHKALPQKALAHKPQRAPPYNNEVPGNNEVSCQEFQELWNDLHKQVVVQYKVSISMDVIYTYAWTPNARMCIRCVSERSQHLERDTSTICLSSVSFRVDEPRSNIRLSIQSIQM